MRTIEELRETIVSMQRELDRLRQEASHSRTLLDALDALLVVSGEDDPFSGVFDVLLPIFDAAQAIVLVCPSDGDDVMECVASNEAGLLGSRWQADARLQKALKGRIMATLGSQDAGTSASGDLAPGADQPALYLPLAQHGRRGLLLLLRERGKPGFDRSHVTLAKKFSLLASHALAAREAHHRKIESQRLKQLTDQLTDSQHALAYRANHDQLTGLPNRAHVQELVNERLSRKRPGEKLALAFIDLDDFKRVNDVYGHDTGDALLRGVAERLRAQIRGSDILGRISGDEFVVMIDPFRERNEVVSLVQRISELLHQPFDLNGIEVKGSGSIGVALYPVHGRSYEALRRNADTAMYRAKTLAKGSVEFFSRALSRSLSDRQRQEEELRAAFADKMFHCALQAKVELRSGRIIGFELLLRRVDAQGIVRAPASFLSAVSEFGLLDGITLMQVDELLSWLPRLDPRFGEQIVYSLNLSALQASHPGFMKTLIGRIAQSGRARNFALELTEDSLLRTTPFQSDILPLLRMAGIGIAIDDFGTGYSSLSTLAELSIDEIKIDRSFIACIQDRPNQQSILRAIGSLGRTLGIRLVAEGIETESELGWLLDHSDIHMGQGFLFHRPDFISALLEVEKGPPLSAITQAITDRLAKPAR